MKKTEKSKGTIFSFWQKARLDGRIFKLAVIFRKKLDIPDKGFSSTNDYDSWLRDFLKTRRDKERVSVVHDFISEAKSILPYTGILKENHFKMLVIEFFYYNSVEDEMLEGMKYSEFEVILMKDGVRRFSHTKEITDGIYIKIGPFSTKDSLKNFVDSKKKLIKEFQDLHMILNNINKIKKPKYSENYKRDYLILAIDEHSKKEIEEALGKKTAYKDIAISLLAQDIGFKNVTPSIVKSVKQRRRIK